MAGPTPLILASWLAEPVMWRWLRVDWVVVPPETCRAYHRARRTRSKAAVADSLIPASRSVSRTSSGAAAARAAGSQQAIAVEGREQRIAIRAGGSRFKPASRTVANGESLSDGNTRARRKKSARAATSRG